MSKRQYLSISLNIFNWRLAFILLFTLITVKAALANLNDVSVISCDGHEAVRAKIVKNDPVDFIINVHFLANLGANQKAQSFAVYTQSKKPDECPDFRHLKISYIIPSKYEREFNLSKHPEVIEALAHWKCVIITNDAVE